MASVLCQNGDLHKLVDSLLFIMASILSFAQIDHVTWFLMRTDHFVLLFLHNGLIANLMVESEEWLRSR